MEPNTELTEMNFHCEICMTTYTDSLNDDSYTLSCGHTYCSTCLLHYFKSKIVDGETRLKCIKIIKHSTEISNSTPDQIDSNSKESSLITCDHIIIDNDIQHIIQNDSAIIKKYTKFKFMYDNKYGSECPFEYCETLQIGNPDQPIITCISCQKQYCYHHSTAHPIDMTCAEYIENTVNSDENKLNTSFISSIAKPCPNCGKLINKSGGCNHMKCICGTNFCWLCLTVLDDDVFPTHFQWWNVNSCSNLQMMNSTQPSTATRICTRIYTIIQFVILGPIVLISTLVSMLLCCFCITELWKDPDATSNNTTAAETVLSGDGSTDLERAENTLSSLHSFRNRSQHIRHSYHQQESQTTKKTKQKTPIITSPTITTTINNSTSSSKVSTSNHIQNTNINTNTNTNINTNNSNTKPIARQPSQRIVRQISLSAVSSTSSTHTHSPPSSPRSGNMAAENILNLSMRAQSWLETTATTTTTTTTNNNATNNATSTSTSYQHNSDKQSIQASQIEDISSKKLNKRTSSTISAIGTIDDYPPMDQTTMTTNTSTKAITTDIILDKDNTTTSQQTSTPTTTTTTTRRSTCKQRFLRVFGTCMTAWGFIYIFLIFILPVASTLGLTLLVIVGLIHMMTMSYRWMVQLSTVIKTMLKNLYSGTSSSSSSSSSPSSTFHHDDTSVEMMTSVKNIQDNNIKNNTNNTNTYDDSNTQLHTNEYQYNHLDDGIRVYADTCTINMEEIQDDSQYKYELELERELELEYNTIMEILDAQPSSVNDIKTTSINPTMIHDISRDTMILSTCIPNIDIPHKDIEEFKV